MKAAQLMGPKRFEFVEVEQPTPADGQCLIKLERISVCGSDIRNIYGPVHPEEDYPMPVGRPCHEIVFSPTGRVLSTHPLRVDRPTNCCFGDADLRTLYVTTGGGHLLRARTEHTGWIMWP